MYHDVYACGGQSAACRSQQASFLYHVASGNYSQVSRFLYPLNQPQKKQFSSFDFFLKSMFCSRGQEIMELARFPGWIKDLSSIPELLLKKAKCGDVFLGLTG